MLRSLGRTFLRRALPALFAVPAVALATPAAMAYVPEGAAAETASFNGPVRVIRYDGTRMYVGGDFTTATDDSGTVRRARLAAIDIRTGQLLRWNPGADRSVRALAVAGDRVYVGGDFTRVRGVPRARIAAVSKWSHGRLVRTFRHRVNGAVNTLAVRHRRVYAGGSFTAVNRRTRSRLAAFSVRTGALDRRWRPGASNSVLALVPAPRRVYVAGLFTRLNGRVAHGYLGAVRIRGGAVDRTFNPVARYPFLDLALGAQGLYAAGDGPGGHLHSFSLRGGQRWALATNGAVQAVRVLEGRVYAGGHFTTLCTNNRNRPNGECLDQAVERRKIFAVSASGRRLGWSPDADSDLGVLALAVHPGQGLLAMGGNFKRLGGPGNWYDRPHIAQFG